MDATVKKIMKLRERHVSKALKKEAARRKTAASIVAGIKKQYGKESLDFVITDSDGKHVPCFSTGRYELDDFFTGQENRKNEIIPHTGGGIPRGRIIEIYGPESSGKTTFALHLIAAAQAQGDLVAFVDAEHALDKHWAAKMGVNTADLMVSQPDYGEQALEIVDSLVRTKKIGLIVVDSVAALVPKKEIEQGSNEPGLQARMMSKSLRKLASLCEKSGTTVVFINQVRMKIGVMFGNPETTPGGNALKFYSSIRLETRFGGQLKKKVKGKDRVYGILMRLKGVKNKVASPFRQIRAKLEFGVGLTEIGEDIKA